MHWNWSRSLTGLLLLGSCGLWGCSRSAPPEFKFQARLQEMAPEVRQEIVATLSEECGTSAQIRMLADKDFPAERLQLGYQVYTQRCEQCHGVSGDGAGPAAEILRPRPRDYRMGIFKFTSTPYGSKPRRADLLRTLKRGIVGTSMPSFKLLPENELQAVIDYVLALTHRGELELALINEHEGADSFDKDIVKDSISLIRERWAEAEDNMVHPLTPEPKFTTERVTAGREAFLTKGCSKCHGEDGRGMTIDNFGNDGWGHATKAADLTSGMLHGGSEPQDIYWRIMSGINGTPMPGFHTVLSTEPETIWNLVSYVQYISNRRRKGVIPHAAPFKPGYLSVSAAPDKTK